MNRPGPPEREADAPAAPAGLLRRLAVICYDTLLLFGVLFAATLIILPLTRGRAVPPHDALYTAYLLAVSYGYFAWFWTHGGQTLGMRAWGVHLVDAAARPPTWKQCLVRFVAALASWLPFGFGFIWSAFDREKRAWHDMISGTRLVHQPFPGRGRRA